MFASLNFVLLLVVFWFIAGYFNAPKSLPAFFSFALLLAPYWALGFGAEGFLRKHTKWPALAALVIPYLVYAIPTGNFRWDMCLGLLAAVLLFGALVSRGYDWFALLLLALAVELHIFDRAWPSPLTGLSKLVFVDAGLYGYLVIRPIGGIGFDWRPRLRDLGIGLREFLYYTPIALALGLATQFLHIHKTAGSVAQFASGWLFTLFLIAMPEEIFFRGLLLNLLERRIGTRWALAVTAILFGLAHFNKRTTFFNGRYVILAAISGVFYGRAWLDRRRLLSSSITHATVDTVWSIWLR